MLSNLWLRNWVLYLKKYSCKKVSYISRIILICYDESSSVDFESSLAIELDLSISFKAAGDFKKRMISTFWAETLCHILN